MGPARVRLFPKPDIQKPKTPLPMNRTDTSSPTKLKIQGNWNIAKGRLKRAYAQLTDDDLQYVEGREDELLGRLQKRTGADRATLEHLLAHDDEPQTARTTTPRR